MKIVYLGYNSFLQHKRGVENVIDFQSRACDFEKIYYFHWGLNTAAYKNGNFICLSIKQCWYWPLLLNILLFRVRRNKKLIIHSHNPLFSFFSIFRTDIFTVHDGLYYLNKSKRRKLLVIFYIIEKLLYFRCSIVHFISEYTKKQSLFGKRRNFLIIPNTSHFESFGINEIERKVPSEKISILIVRSIEERARFDLLMDVAARLDNKKYRFIIAGKGPLLEHYKKQIVQRELLNVEMLGYVSDNELLNLYTNCDILLMIADYGEGFGLPVIEGYLFNKPVIASNRCAIPEVIISEEYLFENTVDSIVESINFASRIPSVNFIDYYKTHFSNSIVLSEFRNLYLRSLS